MKKLLYIFILFLFSAFMISCIGVSTDIRMNRDGSGRITMEYRISKVLDSLGALDGNESMPPVPVSRVDWERSVSRIPGAKLVSHSRREISQDTIISAVIDFNDSQALCAVLSASGDIVSVNSGAGTLNMIFNKSGRQYDADLSILMQTMFSGYSFSFSFSAPDDCAMTFTDGRGNPINSPSAAAAVLSGRRVSLSMNTLDVINQSGGLGARISW